MEHFARGPAGELLATSRGGTDRLSLTDAHGDVVAAFDPANTSLTTLNDSTAYDPFGKKIGGVGNTGNLGFQGDWTDPDTGQVDMGARWYNPGTGTFTSRDTVTYTQGDSILANRYTYGAGTGSTSTTPMATGPSGHAAPAAGWPTSGTRASGSSRAAAPGGVGQQWNSWTGAAGRG